MSVATHPGPLVVEIDQNTWQGHLDNFERWLGNVLMTQATYRKLAENAVGQIAEPHIKEYLQEIQKMAVEHEQQAEKLYQIIGRDPSQARKTGATLMARSLQGLENLEDASGGAVGGWKTLRQLLLANLDSIGSFGVAEQIGLALGLHEVLDITFPIVNEKTKQQLILQEYMLEMGPAAILYKAHI